MGPTSHTGPKTSRVARDSPEPNPRRNQTSRHDIAGDSPERRPAGGAATTKSRDGSTHNQPPSSEPASHFMPAIVACRGATAARSGAQPSRDERPWRCATSAHHAAHQARIKRHERRTIVARKKRPASTSRNLCANNQPTKLSRTTSGGQQQLTADVRHHARSSAHQSHSSARDGVHVTASVARPCAQAAHLTCASDGAPPHTAAAGGRFKDFEFSI
ncbi:hypothetical protein F511_46649 [Dorcoceras hygrometricum]|uniref:Uncharacterized protein n=1 Tax=Dorcoceras hygrometricum TaxID=472368 RepID=A0A2Z6ZT02_9LAMI|nr:hypothetical protein F511_46649 [Dorcoceras hygrometricum]